MHRRSGILLVAGIIVCLLAGSVHAGSWRFPVGLAYVNGYDDVRNLYVDNRFAEEGFNFDYIGGVPLGIVFQPYYQFDFGLGIGAGLGPVTAIFGDRTFFDLPVSIDARFAFLLDADYSPYFRAGVKKHFASGDYVNGSTAGVFGGFGVEFFRKKRVGLGVELLVDKSTVEFETKKRELNFSDFGFSSSIVSGKESIEPSKFLISVFAIF